MMRSLEATEMPERRVGESACARRGLSIRFALVASVLGAILSISASCSFDRAQVRGIVVNSERRAETSRIEWSESAPCGPERPIARATIAICDSYRNVLVETITDDTGIFELEGPEWRSIGRMVLSVKKDGFRSALSPIPRGPSCNSVCCVELVPTQMDRGVDVIEWREVPR